MTSTRHLPIRHLRVVAASLRPFRAGPMMVVAALLLTCWAVLGGNAHAQVVSSLKQHDVDQPIEAAARTQVLLEKEKLAVLEGDAEIRQGDLTLRADRILIHYDKNAPKDRSPVERVEARGHVHLSSPSEKVRAQWGIYDVRGHLISLGGKVRLERTGNVLEGARMEIDLDDGLIRLAGEAAPGGGESRVFGRFRAPVEEKGRESEGVEKKKKETSPDGEKAPDQVEGGENPS
ncbi:MAG: hypothetical protein D6757_08640 [Alphaproteobacteria bacterium]|nr:MAG: hypothetical protein D6757_08640 [Alphaproteobacteria bacterium]